MAITAIHLHIGHRSRHPNPVVSLSARDAIEHLLTLPIGQDRVFGSIMLEGSAEQCIIQTAGPLRNSVIRLAGGAVSLGYCPVAKRQKGSSPSLA
jgi:hypothetical protein